MNWKVFHENKFSTTHKVIVWIILSIMVFSQLDMIIHLAFESLHILFEILESTLDHLVEHIFHTDTRATQIITFYLMLIIAALIFYMLIIMISAWCCSVKYKLRNSYHRWNENIFGFWRTACVTNKAKWWAVFVVFSSMLALGLLG